MKACVLIPNFSNPLGSLLPDHKKQQLVALAKRHQLTLIEDDIYGDLSFCGERPRIGWMLLPKQLFSRAEYLKYVTNLAAPTLLQLALADFLAEGGYERHLRQVRSRYVQQINLFTNAISKKEVSELYSSELCSAVVSRIGEGVDCIGY